MVERILYIWSIRHPASGYVQGINDLVTPFLMVFLQDFVDTDVTRSNFQFDSLEEKVRKEIEADSFWCMTKVRKTYYNIFSRFFLSISVLYYISNFDTFTKTFHSNTPPPPNRVMVIKSMISI